MISISNLTEFLTKQIKGRTTFIKNLYKDGNSLVLCVYADSPSSFAWCELEAVIRMNLSGVITSIIGRNENFHPKLSSLVTQQIDLNSYSNWRDKIVHDQVVFLNSSNWLGFIDNGKFKPFTVKNILNFNFPTTYNEDKQEYGDFHLVETFKEFLTKYQSSVTEGGIYNNHSTKFHFMMRINGLSVKLNLEKFFRYELSVSIYSPKENKMGFNSVVTLKGDEVNNFDSVINELVSNKLSLATKAKILTNSRGSKCVELEELPQQSRVLASLRFDGNRGRPRGKYEFDIDFENQLVHCASNQSKKYIPNKVNELTTELRDLERNNYYF